MASFFEKLITVGIPTVGGFLLGGPAGAAIGAGIGSSMLQSGAAQEAASTQAEAAQSGIAAQERATTAGIEEQRRQFNEIQKLLTPYVQAGQGAIGGFQPFQQAGQAAFEQQAALLGLAPQQRQIESTIKVDGVDVPISIPITDYVGGDAGRAAQQAAISQIESSPFLQSQIEQGERALLQRASATGGLRGGNIQAALAQFRPQMLQQAIEQQYGRLGGFAGTGLGVTEALFRGGQAAAAGQASQAGALGQGIAGALQQQGAGTSALLQQQGAAMAGGQLAGAAPFVQAAQFPLQLDGMNYARTGQFGFGNLFGGLQPGFSQTGLGGSGFGTGLAYGNQDIGGFL